ncbi:MAG TPA: response regulator [Vicinamibacterales bacterium]
MGDAAAPRQPTILVIDDEAAVRNVTQSLLERAGYRVLTATGGAEGLAVIEEMPEVDLVLLDLTMPGMNGREVLTRLSGLKPAVPVVLSSGYCTPETLPEGPNVAGFLPKPFRVEELLDAVGSVLPPPG